MGAHLANMQLISKHHKWIKFLLCVVDIFSKYDWVVPLKDKKAVTFVNTFQTILDNSKKTQNKILVDQGRELHNIFFKKLLKGNAIEMHSTFNEGKSIVTERSIRTLKNKIYKHMTAVSKNVYFNVLDNIVDIYNPAFHNTIKMKPIDVKSNSYAEYNINSNKKDAKLKIGDDGRISKYKNVFTKGDVPNWAEEVFVIIKIKNIVPSIYVINDINGEKYMARFMRKTCRKLIKNNLE